MSLGQNGSMSTVIDAAGDLLLEIQEKEFRHRFRASSTKLRNVSVYFRNLLDPDKFQEGALLEVRLQGLRVDEDQEIDETHLPVIIISDIPNPPSASASLQEVLQTFFAIVHETTEEDKARVLLTQRKLPMSFITRLALIADRFLAIESIKPAMDAYHKTQQLSKEAFRQVYSISNENYWRQRILVGIWFGYINWVFGYSRFLIQHGSEYWLRMESGEESDLNLGAALWAHLPLGIEEEMMHRRICILNTIASLQDFFLERYTSGQRQCRLGYDSSPQCDLFQLGQIVRFFNRKEFLALKSNIDGSDWSPSYSGNIPNLLKTLRQCPSYQIDSNHAHCGIRTFLVPRIEYLESWISDPLHIGICLSCWLSSRKESSWLENPCKEPWKWHQRIFLNSSTRLCDRQHKAMREVFTSEKRNWSPEGS